ncbi:MAG: hypothetical protein AAGJ92_07960 [Pseudomonadota bacterium]
MIRPAPKTLAEATQRAHEERSRVFLNAIKTIREGLRSAFVAHANGQTT